MTSETLTIFYTKLNFHELTEMVLDFPIGTICAFLMYLGLVYIMVKMVRVFGWEEI